MSISQTPKANEVDSSDGTVSTCSPENTGQTFSEEDTWQRLEYSPVPSLHEQCRAGLGVSVHM